MRFTQTWSTQKQAKQVKLSATDFCEDFWFPARSASVCSVFAKVLHDKNDDAWTTSSKFKLDLVASLLVIPCNNGVGQWA